MVMVHADNRSMDVAVFCLALMGTDYPSFLQEAHRVLRPGGLLWIAEVSSRFQADPAVSASASHKPSHAGHDFVKALQSSGFKLRTSDNSNKLFVIWELSKCEQNRDFAKAYQWPVLRACSYKKR